MQSVAVTTIINPYWESLKVSLTDVLYGLTSSGNISMWEQRRNYCIQYSWAIPDPETLSFVAEWLGSHVIEMGAGLGYWASLLSQVGIQDLLAFDAFPPDRCANFFFNPEKEESETVLRETFYPVVQGEPSVLSNYPDRTLFLCWPPYATSMASDTLRAYPGQRVVFIGEGDGGCTGDDVFFDLLEKEWHLVAEHVPIQWDGIHDSVKVYERGVCTDFDVVYSESARPERPRYELPSWPSYSGVTIGTTTFLDRLKFEHTTWVTMYLDRELKTWVKRVCPALARKYYPKDFPDYRSGKMVAKPRKRKR